MRQGMLFLTALLLVCLLLSSCGVSEREARDGAERFLLAVQNGDYETAAAQMHPTYRASAEELREYLSAVEDSLGIRFADGMILSGYTSFQKDDHHPTVGGAYAVLEGTMDVGTAAVRFIVTVIRDGDGYGIFNIRFESA